MAVKAKPKAKARTKKAAPVAVSGEAPEPKPPKLTDKQRMFCLEYAACLNATQAAKKAGYSEDSAFVEGSRLLRNAKVRAEIDRLLAERMIGPREVLERFAQQATAAHTQFLRVDHNQPYFDFEGLVSAGLGHLIKSVKRDGKTGRVTEVEFYDAQSALRDLGRHYKLFTDKIETEDVSKPDQNTERFRFLVDFLKSTGT